MHLTPIYDRSAYLDPIYIQELQTVETAIATLESTPLPDLEFYALIDKISGLNVAKMLPHLPNLRNEQFPQNATSHTTYHKLQSFQRLALEKIHRDERAYESLSAQAESTTDPQQLEQIEQKMRALDLPQKLSYFAIQPDQAKRLDNLLTNVCQKRQSLTPLLSLNDIYSTKDVRIVVTPLIPKRTSSTVTEVAVGFENKDNNCWTNVFLHAVIHIDSLRAIYKEVVEHYRASGPRERKNARRLERALSAYDTALTKRKPVPEKVSNDVRKALSFFSKKGIDEDASIQEDAHDALSRLMGLYADIHPGKNILDLSPLYFSDVTIRSWEQKELVRNYSSKAPSYIHKTSEKIGITEIPNPPTYEIELCLTSSSKKILFSDLIQDVFCNEDPEATSTTFIELDTGKAHKFKMTREERRFVKAPEELMVTLKRFSFNQKKQKAEKITTEIPVPMELKLPGMDSVLELDFFFSHIGNTASGGHYVCYYKDISGQWISLNDKKAQFCSEDEVKKALRTSYVHHYKINKN